jgi:hypothetical protein
VSEREEFFEQNIREYLEEEYEERYRCAVEIDQQEEAIAVFISREPSSETPIIGSLIDDLLEEADIENYSFKADQNSL